MLEETQSAPKSVGDEKHPVQIMSPAGRRANLTRDFPNKNYARAACYDREISEPTI